MNMTDKLEILNKTIINCNKCRRLVDFRKKIATEKTKRFMNENYWGRPITGFGDPKAKVMFVGLAPAAHGGNRTGRVFTGDKSAEFLFKCLFKVGYSNQPNSDNIGDGLRLIDAYLTTALKCVPPQDKPTSLELKNCFSFFSQEIDVIKSIKVVVCLGKIAFDTCIKSLNLKNLGLKFSHGQLNKVNNSFHLASSYHPSPRNVNTGRLTEESMLSFLKKLRKLEDHI